MESLRPKSMRLRGDRASGAVCLLAAACCVLLAGCNSGKQLQRDLIHRELRLQEDEIYRLEDYLEEYQRKVCALRQENQDLKQQLSGGASSTNGGALEAIEDEHSLLDTPEDIPPHPDDIAPEFDERFVPPDVPTIDLGDPIDPPSTPFDSTNPPAIDLPAEDEAPPFRPSVPDTAPRTVEPPILPEEISAPAPAFEPLGFDIGDDELSPIAKTLPSVPVPTIDEPPATATEPTIDWIAIESQPGPAEPNGQPTLLIRVAPMVGDDVARDFTGEASLMLRTPDANRVPGLTPGAPVARWDYTPEEVGPMPTSEGYEFLVALPHETPTGRPLELWVRLVEESGEKALGVAPLTLPTPVRPEPILAEAPIPSPPRAELTSEPVQTASWAAPVVAKPLAKPFITPPRLPELPPRPTSFTAPAKPAVEWQGTVVEAPTESTIRVSAVEATLPPPATNPWHEKGRDAEAPRPLDDPGISFEP